MRAALEVGEGPFNAGRQWLMPRQRMIFWEQASALPSPSLWKAPPGLPPTNLEATDELFARKVIVFRRLSSLLNGRRLLPYFSSSDLRFSFGSRRAAGITGWLLGVTSIVGGGPLGGNGSNACSRSFV